MAKLICGVLSVCMLITALSGCSILPTGNPNAESADSPESYSATDPESDGAEPSSDIRDQMFPRAAHLDVPEFGTGGRILHLGEQYANEASEEIKAASKYSGQVQIMGYLIQLPVRVMDLWEAGLKIHSYTTGTATGSGDIVVTILGYDEEIVLNCYALNQRNEDVPDGELAMDTSGNLDALSNVLVVSLPALYQGVFLPGGVSLGSTRSDVVATWGEPSYIHTANDDLRGDYYFEYPSFHMPAPWGQENSMPTSYGTQIFLQFDEDNILVPEVSRYLPAAKHEDNLGLMVGEVHEAGRQLFPTKHVLPVPISMFSSGPDHITLYNHNDSLFAINNRRGNTYLTLRGEEPVPLDDRSINQALNKWILDYGKHYSFSEGSPRGNASRGNRVTVVEKPNGDKAVVELLQEADGKSVSVLLMYLHSNQEGEENGASGSLARVFTMAPYTEGAVIYSEQTDYLYGTVVAMAQSCYLSDAQWGN